jgi:hypothetical protein
MRFMRTTYKIKPNGKELFVLFCYHRFLGFAYSTEVFTGIGFQDTDIIPHEFKTVDAALSALENAIRKSAKDLHKGLRYEIAVAKHKMLNKTIHIPPWPTGK